MMKHELRLSPLTMECYDGVIALWRRCEGIGLSDADSRENIQAYLERNPQMSYIARSGDRIIGAVLAGHDGRRGYLHHLAVDVEFRRQGLGRRLVDQALQTLAAQGIQKCHLLIFQDNAPGAAFWRRIGWQARTDIGIISKDLLPSSSSGRGCRS